METVIPANPGFSILVFNPETDDGYDEYPVIGWRVRTEEAHNIEPVILGPADIINYAVQLKYPDGLVEGLDEITMCAEDRCRESLDYWLALEWSSNHDKFPHLEPEKLLWCQRVYGESDVDAHSDAPDTYGPDELDKVLDIYGHMRRHAVSHEQATSVIKNALSNGGLESFDESAPA